MKPIRVFIVEDSAVVRQLLTEIIAADERLAVAGAVASAEEALEALRHTPVDVITMDIRLPGMNGFEATTRIMSEHPTPIVVVSASVATSDLRITMNALQAGALSVLEKPVAPTHSAYAGMARHLCNQLVLMSEVKVVRQHRRRSDFRERTPRPAVSVGKPAVKTADFPPYAMVGIVASTGGPKAVSELLSALPPDFPLPILLVQHITESFLTGFVSWLNSMTVLTVSIPFTGERPLPGHVYVAPGSSHLVVRGMRLGLTNGGPVCNQRPSGTVLLDSMAEELGCRSIGVVLTGMGDDGASGLLAVKQAGGYTIAEDSSTAVVYGMPAAAAALDAACEQLPLPQIASRLLALTRASVEVVS